MSNTEIESRIRRFIDENFIFSEDDANLDGAASLLDAGLVDSTGILELVTFLESDFAIQVADAEIIPDNLDSIDAIVAYVASKQGAASSVAA